MHDNRLVFGGNNIGPTMRRALVFIAEHPGCFPRDVIRHVYPQSVGPKRTSSQSGRALIDRLMRGGLVWDVASDENRSRTRRLYPIAVCRVHTDCSVVGLEAQMDCARENPVAGWKKTMPHVHGNQVAGEMFGAT